MTEWGVVGVLIALVGLIVTVATPLIKLNATIVKLTSQMESLLTNLEQFKTRYKEHLTELTQANQRQDMQIADHEHRITVLESSGHEERDC